MTTSTTTPQPPWHTHTVRITEIVTETDDVATYRLVPADPASTTHFTPGQFNMLYLPGVGESAISMSGDPTQHEAWTHTVRAVGNVTRTLARMTVGETLGLRGPFGTGWPLNDLQGNDLVIVAGGLGLAPLRPLIYHVLHHRADFGRVCVIIGARTPEGLLYPVEYDNWRSHGLDVNLTVDRPTADWTGQVGVVTLLVDRLRLQRPEQTHLVMCGPEVMMKYAAISGRRLGITNDRTWVSLERNMQCAVGFCGHCQLGPAFLCKDGPVLRYDRIRPYLSVEAL